MGCRSKKFPSHSATLEEVGKSATTPPSKHDQSNVLSQHLTGREVHNPSRGFGSAKPLTE
jgi:hypothetical protein